MSPAAEIACTKCHALIPVAPVLDEMDVNCPSCGSQLEAFFFPAFRRPVETSGSGTLLNDPGEASCFYHPQKQAVRVCDGCGRFICSLCSIEMGTGHLCPTCISSGGKKAKATLVKSNVRHDNVALSLAVSGIFMSIFSFVLAPAAIFIAVRHWNSPGGLLGQSRVRLVLAILLALASLVFWGGTLGLGFYTGLTGHAHHPVSR
jgi:uncharacterized paraquat-inducible protein A